MIIGISGACRREELYKMVLQDIAIKDDIILITIPVTKTNISRSFAISKNSWVAIVQKYLQARRKNTTIKDRLFLKYQNGKCVNSPVGINTIGSIPSRIATFLNLDDPKDYSGHCFRRSSATLLANKGGDLLSLKRFGGWKSSTVAESYVEESLKRRIDVADMLTDEAGPSSKRPTGQKENEPLKPQQVEVEIENRGINNPSTVTSAQLKQLVPGVFSHVENCNISVSVYNNCVFEKK